MLFYPFILMVDVPKYLDAQDFDFDSLPVRQFGIMPFLLLLKLCIVSIHSFTEVLDLVKEAIDRAGYNDRIKLAMDVAATDFCIGDD